jgi:hypothetical protein
MLKARIFLVFFLFAGSTPAQTPTPFGFSSQMSTTLAQGSTGNGNPTTGCWDTGSVGLNPYYFCLPDSSIAGNTIVAACEWGSTSGLGTPTLVDDRSQTYTSQMQQIRSGGYSVQAWIFSNTVANVHQLKLSWSGTPPSGNMKCNAFQVANVAPSSPSCGTAVGANYTSGTAVSAGSIAASQSGCLFVQVGSEDGGALATWASGSSWTLQDADPRVGFAIQTIVAGSGSTPCSMSISTGSSGATLCFALLPSSAAQGSVPTGMYVSHMQLAPAFDGVSSYTYQFPGSGNLCVMTSSSNTTDALPSSVTSTNPTATWTKVGATVMGGEGNETVWYAGDNVGCTPTTTITVRFTSASTNTDDLYFLDLAGAATSSVLDTCTGGGGASCANSLWSNSGNQGDFSNPVTIGTFTPGSSGGMIIVTGGIADNGSTSFSPTGYQDDQDNNDLHAHYKYTSNATQTFAISADERQAAGGIGPWSVAAVAFKAASSSPGGTLPATISVSLAPTTTTIQVGQSLPFTATLQNDTLNKGVSWSLSGSGCSGTSCGTLTNVTTTSVTYAAPASTPTPATVTLLATSVADSTKSASATITIASVLPISVSVSPSATTVQISQSSTFIATLQNDTLSKGVTWSLSGSGCSISSCGTLSSITTTSVIYTAPASVPTPSSVTLTATSVADTTKTGVSIITVSAAVAQSTITTVGTTQASKNRGSRQWSVGITPVAGDALLVGCDFNAGISFVGVSDSAGDTFAQIGPEADSSNFAARAFLATNVKGGSTTVTCSAASGPSHSEIYVTELNGVNPTSPVDKVLSVGGSTSPATGSLSTTNANEFVWAYIVSNHATNASGWTSLSTFDNNLVASETQATPGTVSASFPVTTNWTLLLAALNPVGVGGSSPPLPISVSVSPSSTNVQVGLSTSFAATLQNDTLNKGVSWSLSGSGCSGSTCGTLTNVTTTSVTYTAPPAVPAPATVALLATSVADSTKSASSTITVVPAPSISVAVSPSTATVQVSQSSPFTATLQNDTLSKGVSWSLSGSGCSGTACGTLTNVTTTSVTYTAPATVPTPATVTLLATSVADSTKSASSTITVAPAPPISVSVSPATVTVQISQSSPFTATLQNDTLNKGVSWSLSGSGCSGTACGTLTNVTTTSVTYTAPSSVPNPSTVSLTATSVADTTKSTISTITVSAAVAQSTIATVGTTKASNKDGSKQWSVAVAPVAGDTLLVGCDFNAGITFVSLSDSAGDTFTQVAPEADSTNFAARAFIATNVKGGSTTVTCTAASAPANNEIYVTELKGVNPAAPIDKALSVGGSTSSATGSLTTANANEFLWAYIISGEVTNASGWTQLSNFDNNLIASITQATPAAIQASFPVSQGWTLIDVALNPLGSGSAAPAISVSVTPAAPTVQVLATANVTATLQNDTSGKGVSWSLSGSGCSGAACGTLTNATTTSVTYTAPAAVPSSSAVTLQAIAIADTTKSSSASITVQGKSSTIAVSLSPKRGAVTLTQPLQFTATVTGDSQNLGVTWSVDGTNGGNASSGTISASGLFTPSASTAPGSHTIAATSVANSTFFASSSIAVTDLSGVFTHHYDPQRTGQNLKEYALSPSSLSSSTFGVVFSCSVNENGTVPGFVYAQPLYVANLTMSDGKKHNVVFVATESDFVYAFDADASPCQQLWKISMLKSGETTVPDGDTGETGDLVPEIGVTSTPVIDPSTNTLYVCAKSKDASGNYHHRLHSLSLITGLENSNSPTEITASGFDVLMHLQRPALLLSGDTIYIAFGSHGDLNTYHGWLMGYDKTGLNQTFVWVSTALSSNTQGAIWSAGTGPALDSSGNVWVETANGSFDGTSNFGDSVVKLSSSGSLLDFFTPYYQDTLRANHVDLGSAGVLILPPSVGSAAHPNLAVATGKPGGFYLLDQSNLGKFNSSSNNDVQEVFPQGLNTTSATSGVFGQVAYWNGNLYISAIGDSLRQYPISNASIATASNSNSTHVFSYPAVIPAVSANGTSGAIVWGLEIGGYTPGSPVVLHAFNATNLASEIYTSPSSGSGAAGIAVKFSVPTVANGKVYVGGQGSITVFGLLPN